MGLLNRLQRLIAPPAADSRMATLYGACVTQARRPEFYREAQIPDSIDGRFDLLLLHVFLVMRRLEPEVRQQLFDFMFADMDRSLREMGVGDMGVGKKIKPMLAAFYGRCQIYEKALGEDSDALAEALRRNLYGGVTEETNPPRMADYVRRAIKMLENQSSDALLSGSRIFADAGIL